MAHGITELDVHQAADDLVAGGDRPTVERIRAHLGTGSPNTVTRHLETWWSSVGARLRRRALEEAHPDVPGPVMTLAQRCWTAALEGAGEHARTALAAEQTTLEEQRAQLTADCALRVSERQQLQVALAQVAAIQTSIDLLRSQLAEATAQAQQARDQRDGAYARNERLEVQLAQLRQDLDERQQAHHSERQEAARHFRTTEERLNQEVDRSRQAARGLDESLAKQATQARTALQALEARLSKAVDDRADALATAAAERARAEQLQRQVESLGALAASVEQALQARPASKAGPTRKRTPPSSQRPPGHGQARPAKARGR